MTRRSDRTRVGIWVVLAAAVAVGCTQGASSSVPRERWERVEFPSVPGDEVADMTVRGGRWHAVGRRVGADGTTVAPRWWHADTRGAWVAGPLAPTTPDGVHARLLGIAAGPVEMAAIGYATGGLHGNQRPILWRGGPDGPLGETYLLRELFGGPRIIEVGRIAAMGDAFVAAGTWTAGEGTLTAQVWWRRTGTAEWSRLDGERALRSRPGEQVWAGDVAATEAMAVLVGRSEGPGRASGVDAAAWWSADGLHWTRTDVRARRADERMQRVVPRGRGFVAVGTVDDQVAVWVSRDGRSWEAPVIVGEVRRRRPPSVTASVDVGIAGRRIVVAAVAAGGVRVWSSVDGGATFDDVQALPTTRAGVTQVALASDGRRVGLAVTSPDGVELVLERRAPGGRPPGRG